MQRKVWVIAFILLVTPQVATAADGGANEVDQAKELVEKGEVMYRLGRFSEALEHFRAALTLANRPFILLNVAQSYRQLKQADKAIFYYKLYLTEWRRQNPNKPPPYEREVQRFIATLAQEPASAEPSVRILGTPVGARVVLRGATDKAPGGGEYSGWLPLELAQVKFGSYELTVTHPKHRPQQRWIWIKPGASFTTEMNLEPLSSTLRTATDGRKMVLVPSGTFWRGSPKGQGDADELPRRSINLKDFYIDVQKVSVDDYAKCVQAGRCSEPGTGGGCNWAEGDRKQHPANCVTWTQAAAYCTWAGKRLPSEAEWEKAARGQDGRTYPWGNTAPTCEQAQSNRCSTGAVKTIPVGALAKTSASPYGAIQLVGNVWEWVNDYYDKDYFSTSPATDPPGPASGDRRVCRGGSWFNPPVQLRATNRFHYIPSDQNFIIGFRCAKDI